MDAYRSAVRERLSPESAAHSERTAMAARALAVRHGENADDAELAGLLHDWSRDETGAEMLAFAGSVGMSVSPAERRQPELLHSRVAAARLRAAFSQIRDEVLAAVAAHTVGGLEMSRLDKLVYTADKVESGRRYAGVERLRAIAQNGSLEDAFRECYLSSVAHVRDVGAELHPITARVLAGLSLAAHDARGDAR